MYPIKIETRPAVTLAALAHRGSYQEIGPQFARVFMLAATRGIALPDSIGYGVYLDDPPRYPPMSCARWPASRWPRCRAGRRVAALRNPRRSLRRTDLHRSVQRMDKPYSWMFSQWLPTSGHEPANFPMFEMYMNDPAPPARATADLHLHAAEVGRGNPAGGAAPSPDPWLVLGARAAARPWLHWAQRQPATQGFS